MLRKLPPGHLLGCFLYQTDLFFQTKAFGNLQIVREGRNLKILGKTKIENSKFDDPTRSPHGPHGVPKRVGGSGGAVFEWSAGIRLLNYNAGHGVGLARMKNYNSARSPFDTPTGAWDKIFQNQEFEQASNHTNKVFLSHARSIQNSQKDTCWPNIAPTRTSPRRQRVCQTRSTSTRWTSKSTSTRSPAKGRHLCSVYE